MNDLFFRCLQFTWTMFSLFSFLSPRTILEQVQGLVHRLLMWTGTFSSWLRSTVETARHHLMNSPRSSRLETKKRVHLFSYKHSFSSSLMNSAITLFFFVCRKCLRLVKSSWSTICSREKLPLSHPEAAAAINPLSLPASIVPSLCWAAVTPPPQSATAVPQLSRVTASHCSVHWPLTQPSARSWSSKGSSGSCLSITCDVAQRPWGRKCVSWSVSSPGVALPYMASCS